MDVTMPQLGETVAEATLTRWLKELGDQVVEGEPLFEVSTDKVDTEIPAAADGTLGEILVAADETVPVGTRLAVIVTVPAPTPPPTDIASVPALVPGVAPVPAPRPAPAAGTRHGTLTPLVRRLLAEHGLTTDQVTGTGPGGRITRDDVLAIAGREDGTPVPAPPTAADEVTVVPFTAVRRRTAEHMVRSKATSAHTLMVVEVDYSGVDRVRGAVAAGWREREGFTLTYLPFVARATVDALAAHPHLNASVSGDALLVHRRVHLGIAVDLDAHGLLVPVLRDAEAKGLPPIARAVRDLAVRARARRLSADDLAGGTFTLSNPGPYGTLLTAPIINQPQVAILATDAVRPRPVALATADGDYAVGVHPVGNLALTFDHRAVDGGYAARFLALVKSILETRDWAGEL